MSGQNAENNYRLMNTNSEAREAIRAVVESATQSIWVFDRSPQTLRERDFDRPEMVEIMSRMLQGGRMRQLRIALHEVTGIEGELPRVVALLGRFGSQVAIHRVTGAAREVEDVMLIADAHSVWRKPVHSHPRSIANLHDEVAARPYIERFGEVWEGSELAVTDRQAGL